MFFNIGGGEILVIAMVALIAVGPEQLPSVLRKIGRFLAQARSVTANLRDEFMSGLDEVNELADPEKWMGSGADDDPVVPRGYAEQQAVTNPAQRRSSDPGVTKPVAADRELGGATGDGEPVDGDPAPVVNEIAAANAMRAEEPAADADDPTLEADSADSVDDADSADDTPDDDREAVDGGTA